MALRSHCRRSQLGAVDLKVVKVRGESGSNGTKWETLMEYVPCLLGPRPQRKVNNNYKNKKMDNKRHERGPF